MNNEHEIRQWWHDRFWPFNQGRDFVVLFGDYGGKPSMALLQLDGGSAIESGGIVPRDLVGNEIKLVVNTGLTDGSSNG